MHAEVLAEDRVVWLARFTSLGVATKRAVNEDCQEVEDGTNANVRCV
jgi:hypothetical protein